MNLFNRVSLLLCGCMISTTVIGHEGIDAAVYNPLSERYFFFFNDVYVSKNFDEDLGNYRHISRFGQNFPEDWEDGVDAVVFNPNTERYFFFKYIDSANEWRYISKDFGGDDFSEPASIDQFAANDFPNQCAIDAALFDPNLSVYYFFREDGSYCSKQQGAGNDFIVNSGTFGGNYPSPGDFPLRAAAFRTDAGTSPDRFYLFSDENYIRRDEDQADYVAPTANRSGWRGWPLNHAPPTAIQPVDIDLPEAIFTDPEATQNRGFSYTIRDRLVELIDAASGELTFGVYFLNDPMLTDALARAHRRGVHVSLLTDDDVENSGNNYERNRDVQGTIDFLHFVETTGYIHNKVAMFSRIDTTNGPISHVVFTSSSNFTQGKSRGYTKFQDALIISDEAVFDAFNAQRDKIIIDDKSDQSSQAGATDGMRAYFFPRNDGDDTVAEILRAARIHPIYEEAQAMKVRINMGSWTKTEKRSGITDELKEISEMSTGEVQIIASGWKGPGKVDAPEIRSAIGDENVVYNFLPGRENAHSKYMLVEVSYLNGIQLNIVFAGSHNFTGNALDRHFENWIQIINPEIYSRYEENFNEIWELSMEVFDDGFETSSSTTQ